MRLGRERLKAIFDRYGKNFCLIVQTICSGLQVPTQQIPTNVEEIVTLGNVFGFQEVDSENVKEYLSRSRRS